MALKKEGLNKFCMQLLKFFISISITIILVVLLNNRIGSVPPMGKFLDPFNGFYRNAETKENYFQNEELNIAGLKDTVSIQYDEFLIPHIQAKNNHDLYLAQGYVTARHRLWQMEIQTHFAAGRLTEIFGESMLERDRLTRRKGLLYGAQRSLAAMEKDSLSNNVLQAYSQGVNAYIADLKYRDIPFEYKLLDYKPEAWEPLKTALLLSRMSDDLAGQDFDLENTNLVNLLGKETFDLLFPERLSETDPVIPRGTKWDFSPEKLTRPEKPYADLFTFQNTPKPDPDNGSNNWAVSGRLTQSGNPILANDPHLGLNLPSIWFALQLDGPDANTMGVSLPGAPAIIIGFNKAISWGVTNATRDVMDWYALQYKTKERKEYAYDGKWLKTAKRVEEFWLRPQKPWSRGELVSDTVLYTHLGPVVYDPSFPGDSTQADYALRWTAHDASNELKAFLQLNRAQNYEEFTAAIAHHHTPAQNFAFASTQGNIAMWVQGKFPLRWEEQGKFLMEAKEQANEWHGFIPQEHNAHILNPERGFVSSANQIPVDQNYPYYTYDQNYHHFRGKRINEVLSGAKNITIKDMMQLQNDNYNLKAAETLPWMLDSLKSQELNPAQYAAFEKLSNWNFMQTAGKEAPVLYEAWWKHFRDLLWDELDSLEMEIIKPRDAAMISLLKKDPDNRFVDIQLTPARESLKDLINRSFADAMRELASWQEEHEAELIWGNYKNSSIRHLTGQEALSIMDMQVDGGSEIVNAHKGRHGPSWRMVVEMSQPVEAYGIYPGGQSGNPGSPYYSNFVESWRKGAYNRLYFVTEQQQFADKMMFSQKLNPTE